MASMAVLSVERFKLYNELIKSNLNLILIKYRKGGIKDGRKEIS
jgi:hypothetical protein